jgi:uncharacterized membrane protein YhaH (DUF805 family)
MEQNQQPLPPVFNQPQPSPQPQAPQYQPRVQATPMMDPITAIKTCFKKYFDFKGRARRSEFWWFALFVLLVSTVLSYLSAFVPGISYVSAVFALATYIPLFAALTRRLHDTNRSGWWVAIMAVFYICYLGSTLYLVGPNLEMFSQGGGDMMAMAEAMANAVQSSPGTATVMAVCSLGFLLFFVIDHIFAVIDSKWGENKYGPSPKYQ